MVSPAFCECWLIAAAFIIATNVWGVKPEFQIVTRVNKRGEVSGVNKL